MWAISIAVNVTYQNKTSKTDSSRLKIFETTRKPSTKKVPVQRTAIGIKRLAMGLKSALGDSEVGIGSRDCALKAIVTGMSERNVSAKNTSPTIAKMMVLGDSHASGVPVVAMRVLINQWLVTANAKNTTIAHLKVSDARCAD